MNDTDILILLIVVGFASLFWRILRPVRIAPFYVIVYLVMVVVMAPASYFIWHSFDVRAALWKTAIFVAIALCSIRYAIYNSIGPKRAEWKL